MEAEPHFFQQTVSEADIDWIICIELNSSSPFRDWFAVHVLGGNHPLQHLGAWRSISNSLGESDILWLVEMNGEEKRLVLIENKINAPAQPEQFQRYYQRGTRYVAEGVGHSFRTMLIAPDAYTSTDCANYEVRLSYEMLAQWFRGVEDERHQFLANVFSFAAGKAVRLAPKDPEITKFRRSIWQLASRDFPHLGIKDPGEVSASMCWVETSYGGFWIKYKMFKKSGIFGESVVDLELPGRVSDFELLKQQFAQDLKPLGAVVVKAGGSVAFRISVPRIVPPHFEEPAVREALNTADTLLTWWRQKGTPRE